MHGDKVIAYTIRKLKVHEKNYTINDLELAIVVLHSRFGKLLIWYSCTVCVHTEELNLHQMRWLEFLKEYDMSVHYHPGKANVVEDSLSRLSMGSVAHVE